MKLKTILKDIKAKNEFPDPEIGEIVYDSRKAAEGTLFVALVGAENDGHDYAASAYENGCRAFLLERYVSLPEDAICVFVPDTRAALAVCSAEFFGHPAEELAVIGITGTKGKTSIAHIIQSVLDSGGMKCGIIGTVGAGYGDVTLPTVNTTPESYEIQKLFRTMADGGCRAVAIEVSSLGLKSHRVDGIRFSHAVFTNLFPDHIGGHEHASFEEYKECKKRLFSQCDKAIINLDDDYSDEFISCCGSPVVTFGRKNGADYRLLSTKNFKEGHSLGVSFSFEHGGIKDGCMVSMPGEINAMNALVAIAVADDLGIEREKTKEALSHVTAKGRGEVFETGRDFSVIIDYAHNGVSLESILETVRGYEHNRIISLFGSVGDRAQLRRKELGEVAGRLSDLCIVTTDDPGFEDPQSIIDDITAAVDSVGGKHIGFVDREEAIRYAVNNALPGDIIVLAGKGHEEFMKVRGKREPFSERKILNELLFGSESGRS